MAEMSRSEEIEGQTQAKVKNDEISLYEIGFHVVPTVAEGDVEEILAPLRATLEKVGAVIVKGEVPKKIQFTYRIERSVSGKREKYTEGYFGWVQFEAKKEAIPVIEESARADKNILRFLLIHTAPHMAPPQPRAVFSSDRLEGETITKQSPVEEKGIEVSDEELDKSLEALVS